MREGIPERWGRVIRDWMDAAGQKTEEIARVSKRQVELMQIDWDLLRKRAELGQRLMRLIDRGELPGWSRDPHLADLVEEARALEREQRKKRDEIRDLRRGGTPDDNGEVEP